MNAVVKREVALKPWISLTEKGERPVMDHELVAIIGVLRIESVEWLKRAG